MSKKLQIISEPKENEPPTENIRLKLILVAGEMFAEKGFKEISIRAISKKAKVNISAINYYFLSKENLYFECVKYVIQNMKSLKYANIDSNPVNPQEVSNLFYKLIYRDVLNHLSPKNPSWYIRLLINTIKSKSPVIEKIVYELFIPEHTVFKNLVMSALPGLTEQQVFFWANSILGQIMFYDFNREILLMLMGKKEYPEEYINALADHIARISIAGLGLPAPAIENFDI